MRERVCVEGGVCACVWNKTIRVASNCVERAEYAYVHVRNTDIDQYIIKINTIRVASNCFQRELKPEIHMDMKMA